MFDISKDEIREARRRDGDAAEDREDVDELLTAETVGRRDGDPLVRDTYAEYPDNPDSLSRPTASEFVVDLLAHPRINSLDDAVSELCPVDDYGPRQSWRDALEKVCALCDVPKDTLLDEGADEDHEDADPLVTLLGDWHTLVDEDSTLVVAALYVDQGLSTGEIADMVEGVDEDTVLDILKEVGLLEGSTREEAREQFRENNGRIGGTSVEMREGSASDEQTNYRGLEVDINDF